MEHLAKAEEVLLHLLEDQRAAINKFCEGYEAWQIGLGAILVYIVVGFVWDLLFQEKSVFERTKISVFRIVRKIPIVRRMIADQLKEPIKDIEKSMFKHAPSVAHTTLPSHMTPEAVLSLLKKEYENCGDPVKRHKSGKVSGSIYIGSDDRFNKISETLTQVYGMFAWSNPLHPGVFPGVRQLEAEVCSMVCKLFNGGPEACASMTSGGTESILIAIKAYRDWARDVKGITNPNLVAPRTAHPAFDKACAYFCINLRKIPEDPVTRAASVRAMARAIDSNTIAIVGSCPQYPHGTVDPIADLGKLALKHNIGLHVDCCLGSFVVAYMHKAGFTDFPDFDFKVPGVTSISCDTHKFGMTPKGSSVVMWSSPVLRRYQYAVFPDWPGGIYGTPTIAGSRPGALIAATWAAMMLQGEDGYIENCRTIVTLTRQIAAGIKLIPGLRLEGRADASVVAWTSDKFNVNRMVDPISKEHGWDLNVLQFPPAIHITVTMAHAAPGVVDRFLADLREVTAEILANPTTKDVGSAAMYGMSQALPDRSIVVDVVHGFLDTMYQTHVLSDKKAD